MCSWAVNRHRVNADAIGSAAPGCHFYFARRVTFLSCADIPCRRPIKMSPLCKVEVTLPRVMGSGACAVAVLSMSKQEFSRLDVLLRVRSGGLRISRGRPNNLKLPAEVRPWRTKGLKENLCFLHPGPSRPAARGPAARLSLDLAQVVMGSPVWLLYLYPHQRGACLMAVRSARQIPAEPVADRAAHHELEVAAFEPRHLFGEHHHALAPRARHAGNVGAPEAALRPERLDDLLRVFVDVAVGVGFARVTGRAGAF